MAAGDLVATTTFTLPLSLFGGAVIVGQATTGTARPSTPTTGTVR